MNFLKTHCPNLEMRNYCNILGELRKKIGSEKWACLKCHLKSNLHQRVNKYAKGYFEAEIVLGYNV